MNVIWFYSWNLVNLVHWKNKQTTKKAVHYYEITAISHYCVIKATCCGIATKARNHVSKLEKNHVGLPVNYSEACFTSDEFYKGGSKIEKEVDIYRSFMEMDFPRGQMTWSLMWIIVSWLVLPASPFSGLLYNMLHLTLHLCHTLCPLLTEYLTAWHVNGCISTNRALLHRKPALKRKPVNNFT